MNRLFITVLAVGLGGCIASHQSIVADVDVDGWSSVARLEMTNIDTLTHRDIEIFARYVPSLVDDSVRLNIKTIAPDSTTYSEEVMIYFDTQISERGACLIGRYPYRRDVVWRQNGNYRVEMAPTSSTKGVEAIGLNIQQTTTYP